MKKIIGICLLILGASSAWSLEPNKEIDREYKNIAAKLPSKGQLISIPFADFFGSYGKTIRTRRVEQDEMIGDKLFLVKVKRKGRNIWDSGITSTIVGAIKSGDTLFAAGWVRAKKLPADGSKSDISMVIGQKAKPYHTLVQSTITPTQQWQRFYISGIATKNFKRDQTHLQYQVAGAKQELEFGPIFVFNMGPGVDVGTLPAGSDTGK